MDRRQISELADPKCKKCWGKGYQSGLNYERRLVTPISLGGDKEVTGLIWQKDSCPCIITRFRAWQKERIVKPGVGDLTAVTEEKHE